MEKPSIVTIVLAILTVIFIAPSVVGYINLSEARENYRASEPGDTMTYYFLLGDASHDFYFIILASLTFLFLTILSLRIDILKMVK